MLLLRLRARFAGLSIWWYAFTYFAGYIPYSALTKALSDGLLPGQARGVSGFALLPALGVGSMAMNWVALSALGWWGHAGRRRVLGVEIPWPGRWTFVAGLCTAVIIPTTSLAYTFTGVSIVFIMLLMRGGVLVIAPLVDLVSGRRVHWWSWAALLLALAALWVGFAGRGWDLTAVALLNAAAYVTAYFIRLRAMSRVAKSDDLAARMRYFVEEQMVAPVVNVVVLGALALAGAAAAAGPGSIAAATRGGFVDLPAQGALVLAVALFAGALSQVTGIGGTLTLMDPRENTFCVPVNRASSVLSGIAASLLLAWLVGTRPPPPSEWAGAALVILAMLVLALGPRLVPRAAPRTSA